MMNECQLPGRSAMDKRPTLNYYVRLESESSIASEEDTESVNSIQDRETEYAQDTSDTESDNFFEYEIASLSEADDEPVGSNSSSGTDDGILCAEEVIAAVLGDSSLEAWAPDGGEDSYSSTTDCEVFGKTDFWTCVQCKSKNNDPRYRLCEKCFQVRKNFYPPRPKRCKKRKSNTEAVNVDNLRSCLSGLSQDSGVGSSQEFPTLDFKEIKVPEQHLNKCSTSSSSGINTASSSGSSSVSTMSSDTNCVQTTSRKRKSSDTFSDNDVRPKKIIIEGPLSIKNDKTESLKDRIEVTTESKDQCIVCTVKKKDGIFLHGNSAHSCCCYKCSIKTWKTTKRCPVCNRRVSNVVKLYTI